MQCCESWRSRLGGRKASSISWVDIANYKGGEVEEEPEPFGSKLGHAGWSWLARGGPRREKGGPKFRVLHKVSPGSVNLKVATKPPIKMPFKRTGKLQSSYKNWEATEVFLVEFGWK